MRKIISYVYGIEFKGKIVYVGVTTQDVRQRFSKHLSCAKQQKFHNQIPKLYPWLEHHLDDVSLVVLEVCDFEKRLERERFFIEEFNTIDAGLNSENFVEAPGRQKGCLNPSGEDHYLYGKSVDPKVWQASVARRIGKPLTENHKRKQREGHANSRLKRKDLVQVQCIETGEIWPSVTDCANHFGCTAGAVINRIRKGRSEKDPPARSKLGIHTFRRL